MILRFAAPHERQALEDLQRRASLIYETYRAALLADPGAIFLPQSQLDEKCVRVVEQDGRALGFTVVLKRDPESCELDGLFVEPDRWKRGIGRALMEDAFAMAREQGFRVMEVLGNPHAEGFYARIGFIHAGTAQTLFGIAPKMKKNL